MLVINSIYYYFRIILLSIESLTALYTTKKSILYYYTDPTAYENLCMMYISLIEALPIGMKVQKCIELFYNIDC